MPTKLIALCGVLIMLCGSSMADVVSELRPAINQAADKYGVSPVMMEAIIRHESANGKSNAAVKYNNLAGIMAKKGLRRFDSKEDCIEKLGEILKVYQDKGLVSLDKISRRYAPYHSKSWVSKVGIFTRQIEAGRWGELEPS